MNAWIYLLNHVLIYYNHLKTPLLSMLPAAGASAEIHHREEKKRKKSINDHRKRKELDVLGERERNKKGEIFLKRRGIEREKKERCMHEP